ncbi:MAG: DinB family protein [Terriglobales bacterium]
MAKKASVQALKTKSAVAPEIERRAHRALRQHLLDLLRGGNAHLNFEEALAGLPPNLRGERPAGLPYSPWRLLEHMRLAQWDILEFSRNPKHVSPEFPAGYWPETDAPPDDKAWQQSVRQFRDDLKAMQGLVEDPSIDLFAPISHGEGQTLLREALLLADHNAYHLGQLVTVRRLLGAWES